MSIERDKIVLGLLLYDYKLRKWHLAHLVTYRCFNRQFISLYHCIPGYIKTIQIKIDAVDYIANFIGQFEERQLNSL